MTKDEKKYMRRVADLGCIACRKLGYHDTPAELHHITNNTLGKRSDNFSVIPLCPYHHRTSKESFHQNPKWFVKTFGSQTDLLEEVIQWLK